MPAAKSAMAEGGRGGGDGTSTSGGAGDELPFGSKYPGLQPAKVKEAVAALLKYVGAQQSADKVLFQEDEMLYLVRPTIFRPAVLRPAERSAASAGAPPQRQGGGGRLHDTQPWSAERSPQHSLTAAVGCNVRLAVQSAVS